MLRIFRWLSRLSIFGFLFYVGRVNAQVPGTIDPGRIPPQVTPPAPPEFEPDIQIKPQPDLIPPDDADQAKFRLRSVEVSGATALHSDELSVTYERDLDTDVSLAKVYEIAQGIQDLYSKKGFFLTRVYVPEQRIREGRIKIEVVEGYIEDIVFSDNSNIRLQKRLSGYLNRILSQRPLQLKTLERNLLLMNDLAGFQVSSTIDPGKTRGGAILTLTVKYNAVSPYFELNNWAAETIGPVRAQAGVFINSPFGQGERITLGGATALPNPEQLANGRIQVSVPVGSDGLSINTSANYVSTRPGAELRKFKISGRSFNYNFGISYPIIRSRNHNVTFGMSFDLVNTTSETRFLERPIVLSNDRVRNLRAQLSYQGSNLLGVTGISVELSQGLGLFGATFGSGKTPTSRFNGDPTASKGVLTATQVFTLPQNINLTFSFAGQLATNALLSTEQFGVGGPVFGSAYNPSQIIGDAGYSLRLELEKVWFTQIAQTSVTLRPYAFIDYGQTFLLKPLPSESPTSELASAGFGLRQAFGNFLQGRLEVAFPFQQIQGIANPRLLFSLQGVF